MTTKKDLPKAKKLAGPRFMLHGMRVVEYAIIRKEVVAGEQYKVKNNYAFGIELEGHIVAANFEYQFFGNEQLVLKLMIQCQFSLEPHDWANLINENTIIFPKGFAAHIMAITVSTARGVLFAKTEGTVWQTKPMKLQNVQEAIKEDITIKLDPTPEG